MERDWERGKRGVARLLKKIVCVCVCVRACVHEYDF